MKKFIIGLFMALSFSVYAEDKQIQQPPLEEQVNELAYFVSFSIPEPQLVTLIKAAERKNIPIYIRGLIHNDMDRTAKAVLDLVKKYNVQGVSIDPNRFEHYGINTVPALVKKCGQNFDVIHGNIEIEQALGLIHSQGECK